MINNKTSIQLLSPGCVSRVVDEFVNLVKILSFSFFFSFFFIFRAELMSSTIYRNNWNSRLGTFFN